MSKILIGLYVPAIEERYDLFVPGGLPISELCRLLAEGLTQMTNGHYCTSGREMLCLKAPDRLLARDMSLAEYGISNGDQLVLF